MPNAFSNNTKLVQVERTNQDLGCLLTVSTVRHFYVDLQADVVKSTAFWMAGSMQTEEQQTRHRTGTQYLSKAPYYVQVVPALEGYLVQCQAEGPRISCCFPCCHVGRNCLRNSAILLGSCLLFALASEMAPEATGARRSMRDRAASIISFSYLNGTEGKQTKTLASLVTSSVSLRGIGGEESQRFTFLLLHVPKKIKTEMHSPRCILG